VAHRSGGALGATEWGAAAHWLSRTRRLGQEGVEVWGDLDCLGTLDTIGLIRAERRWR
jgi:hypothetical protein